MSALTRFFNSFVDDSTDTPAPALKLGMERLESREVASVTGIDVDPLIKMSGFRISVREQLVIDCNSKASDVTVSLSGSKIHVTDATTKVTRSVPVGKVDRVVFNGGDGNDTVRLEWTADHLQLHANGNGGRDTLQGGYAADVLTGGSGNDTLWGNYGDDTLRGDGGNDILYGEGGTDKLFGGSGTDTLYGGGTDHRDWRADGDWLEAGSFAEIVDGGWNAHKPVIGGMKYTDIQQGGMGNCVVMASMAAAAKTGGISVDNISYLGDYTYRVKFFDARHNAIYEDVRFDGRLTDLDPGTTNFESWTVIYNRAYFERFHNLNYVSNPTAGTAFPGETSDAALGRLMPYRYSRFAPDAAAMKAVLRDGWAMTAGLNAIGGDKKKGGHAYMVMRVYDVSYFSGATETRVELYNPWGESKLHGKRPDGKVATSLQAGSTPGVFSISWADFKAMATSYAW